MVSSNHRGLSQDNRRLAYTLYHSGSSVDLAGGPFLLIVNVKLCAGEGHRRQQTVSALVREGWYHRWGEARMFNVVKLGN